MAGNHASCRAGAADRDRSLKPWTREEDIHLLLWLSRGRTIKDLAEYCGRSLTAIEMRLGSMAEAVVRRHRDVVLMLHPHYPTPD